MPRELCTLNQYSATRGDKGLFGELATIFSEESFDQICQIRKYISKGDLKAAAMGSHTLKGAVGNSAAKPAHYAAAHREKLSREGQPHEMTDAVDALEREVNRLHSTLQKAVKEL